MEPSSTSKHNYTVTAPDGSPTKSSNNHLPILLDTGQLDVFQDELQPSSSTVSDLLDNADSEVMAKRRWAILLFSATTVLLFADQNLMSPNLTAMAEEYGFTDEERDVKLGGDIALAFWVLGAPAALVVGCLADHVNRSILFAWTVGIGEGACFLTYWTTTYWALYICRAITGFSIGGALPLIYSILGDMFTADERHTVNALVGIGTGIGISLGQGVAGFLGPTFGWRLPFLIVSVPALTCAAVVLFTVQDPERGGMEQAVLELKKSKKATRHEQGDYLEDFPSSKAAQKEMEMQQLNYASNSAVHSGTGVRRRSNERKQMESEINDDICEKLPLKSSACGDFYHRNMEPTIKSMKVLLSTPTVALALLQGAPGCLPWGIVNTYLNDFLAEDRGMSVEFATFVILCFGIGNFLGLLLGGFCGQHLYRIDKRYPALLAGSMAIFGCVPFWILLDGVTSNTPFIPIATTAIMAGTASGITGPIIKATLQNVTLPTMRGQAFALFNTFDDFGRGLGPVFVAKMIKTLGGRTPAFNVGTLGWVVCGFFNLAVFFTAEGDERRTQATIAADMSKRDHADTTVV